MYNQGYHSWGCYFLSVKLRDYLIPKCQLTRFSTLELKIMKVLFNKKNLFDRKNVYSLTTKNKIIKINICRSIINTYNKFYYKIISY